MATYSDNDFVILVDDKPGNIRFFRTKLKEYNQLSSRQQLNDNHAELFREIKTLKQEQGLSWEQAMNQGITNYINRVNESAPVVNAAEEATVLSVLLEINDSLKNIEELLRTRQN